MSCECLNNLYKKKKSDPVTGEPIMEDPEEEDSQGKIAVFWCCDQEKVNSDMVKRVQIQSSMLGVLRAIMIVKEQTSLARKEQSECMMTLETFQLDDLQVNITHHSLVPVHSVLSDEEKLELLKKYRIQDHQLPKIQVTDPIARYFGVSRGNVMKIVRPSETAGRYITYRIAI